MVATTTKRIAAPTRLLYGPGPAMVEPRGYEAMTQPVLGIRDPYFLELLGEIRDGLRNVLGTEAAATFVIPGSGSAGMEAAVANFVVPDSKFAVFANGHFANRMVLMGERQRANVVRLDKPWGEVFSSEEARQFLERERPQVVGFVQAETSTGAYQSGKAITDAARELGALVIGDCITSAGAMPVEMDANGIDIAYSCTQKALSCPAGLSPIAVSDRAWEWLEKRPENPFAWYLDLKLIRKYFDPPNVYHHTPSPPLLYALHEGLAAIEEEGLRNRLDRHRRAHVQLAAGLERLGFDFVVRQPEARLWHLSIVKPPAGVDEARLRQKLLEKYSIEIATGLGEFAGKVLRIGTMGPLATDDSVDFLLGALTACL